MSEVQQSFLGPGTSFEGKISFAGTVCVEGHFRGEIRADGTLLVAEAGTVDAAVHGRSLVVRGSVSGQVTAKESIEVAASGRLEGSVTTPRIRVEEGAVIQARLAMGEPRR
jgi:cytoskeletal protein CcmA (bactofilin family)